MMGDSGVYGTESKKTICHGVIVVRSLKWPGSFNFYYQGRYFTIYVGNGHKYEEKSCSMHHKKKLLTIAIFIFGGQEIISTVG